MPAVSQLETAQRLGDVEDAIATGKTSRWHRIEIALRYDVQLETVNSWFRQVRAEAIEAMRFEIANPEASAADLLARIRGTITFLRDQIAVPGGRNNSLAPSLANLLALEAKIIGLARDRVEVTHSGSVRLLVEAADAEQQARAVVQALPDAMTVLGLPVTNEIEALVAQLETLDEGVDLLEAIEVEAREVTPS